MLRHSGVNNRGKLLLPQGLSLPEARAREDGL
jgi:hypothetical protein